ncbi:unnamed protein product [Caretta caretta]
MQIIFESLTEKSPAIVGKSMTKASMVSRRRLIHTVNGEETQSMSGIVWRQYAMKRTRRRGEPKNKVPACSACGGLLKMLSASEPIHQKHIHSGIYRQGF